MHGRLTYYFVLYKWRYLAGFAALMGASFIIMVPPLVVKQAIDAIDEGTTRGELLGFFGMLMAIAAGESVLRFFSRQLISGTSRRVEYALRNDVAKRFMELDQAYYLKNQTGDLMARCTNDLQRVRDLAGPAALEITRAVSMIIIGFGFNAEHRRARSAM